MKSISSAVLYLHTCPVQLSAVTSLRQALWLTSRFSNFSGFRPSWSIPLKLGAICLFKGNF
jgi:hypothetical protein